MSADHTALLDTMAEVATVNPIASLDVSLEQQGLETIQERIEAFCADLQER